MAVKVIRRLCDGELYQSFEIHFKSINTPKRLQMWNSTVPTRGMLTWNVDYYSNKTFVLVGDIASEVPVGGPAPTDTPKLRYITSDTIMLDLPEDISNRQGIWECYIELE